MLDPLQKYFIRRQKMHALKAWIGTVPHEAELEPLAPPRHMDARECDKEYVVDLALAAATAPLSAADVHTVLNHAFNTLVTCSTSALTLNQTEPPAL